jgi:hypothetical protein
VRRARHSRHDGVEHDGRRARRGERDDHDPPEATEPLWPIGTAPLIKRADGTFTVKLRMSKPVRFPGPSQNAHIHNVTCANARIKTFLGQLATVVDTLTNLTRGRSTTHVTVPLRKRTTGRFAINVHEQNGPYTIVACGDIPRS